MSGHTAIEVTASGAIVFDFGQWPFIGNQFLMHLRTNRVATDL
jgi:hypothetical protein